MKAFGIKFRRVGSLPHHFRVAGILPAILLLVAALSLSAYGQNTAPVACISDSNRIVQASPGQWEARVTLDASCSFDADDALNDFAWYELVDVCDPDRNIFLGSSQIIDCNLPLGLHVIILKVTDTTGASGTNQAVFNIEHPLPPMLEPNDPNTAIIASGSDSNNPDEEPSSILPASLSPPVKSGKIIGWGTVATPNQELLNLTSIAAGGDHSLALKSDGTIVGWGYARYGQASPPSGTDFVSIAAGGYHSLALKSDGTIVGWGSNNFGQASPPSGSDFVAISAVGEHSLSLKSDGTIVGWGYNAFGQASPPSGSDFVAIAAGWYHSLALKSDGTIVGWGYNNYGQASPPSGSDFVAIAAGWDHSLALKSNGSIVAWGRNNYGQCNIPLPNSGFVTIAAGWHHSLALKSDGTIVGWGFNGYGQASLPSGSDFVAIAAGYGHSLALKSDGTIAGWGYNRYGQSRPPSINDFVAIAAGSAHSLALKSDGTIVGWGGNSFGESSPPSGSDFVAIAAGWIHSLALKSDGTIVGLGWNRYGQSSPPSGSDFVAIAAEGYHSLALKSDGTIVGWGYNDYCQASPPSGSDFVAIAAGGLHSLALKSNGTIAGWGSNSYGQAIPPSGSDFVAIAAGGDHSLALKSDGTIVGWGRNDHGQASPPSGTDFVAISAGSGHSLALKSNGRIVGWGQNWYGQASPPSGSDFVAIAAGGDYSLAIVSEVSENNAPIACINNGNRTIEAGSNREARVILNGSCSSDEDSTPGTNDDIVRFEWYEANSFLGSGEIIECNLPLGGHIVILEVTDKAGQTDSDEVAITITRQSPPVNSGKIIGWGANWYGQCNAPSPNTDFIAVAAGYWHSLGLKRDGSIVAWGDCYFGQCDLPSPNTDFIAIAAGDLHSLGLKSSGTILAWGDNYYGQCAVPFPNSGFVAVSAGEGFSLGLKLDGSIVAWGRNDHGQRNIPSPNSGFVAVATSGYHSLGLKQNGTIVAWGWNYLGMCNVPVPNTDFVAVAAGVGQSFGLKQNGSIVAWGDDHLNACAVTPPNMDFIAADGGIFNGLGLKQDGSLRAWGRNEYGQSNAPTANSFVAISTGGFHSLAIIPAISVSPIILDFNALLDGPDLLSQSITIANYGTDVLEWTITEDCDWLTVEPNYGTLEVNESNNVEVIFNINGLDYGFYDCEFMVSDSNVFNGQPTVPVNLHIYLYAEDELYVPQRYPTIQSAINVAESHQTIVVVPGTYNENINFNGKNIQLISIDPYDPCVVAGTVINGNNAGTVVTFLGTEDANCVLSGFTITGGYTSERGGGICGKGTHAQITRCVIKENYAQWGGGIADFDGKISECIISENRAVGNGGGIVACGGPVSNCVISGNWANNGGGTNNCWGNITNCTIVYNRANGECGGVRFSDAAVSNCIIWGNSDINGSGESSQIDGAITINYSCIKGWTGVLGGVGNIADDPSFTNTGYWDANGTPGDLNDDFWVEGDYRLLKASPCIDSGDPDYVAGPNETDLEGNPRVLRGRIDMGAYEAVITNVAPFACIENGTRTIEAGTGCQARIALDGSCSSDEDSTQGTNDDIVSFEWYEANSLLGSGEIIECNLPLGEHIIVLEVTDQAGESDSNEVVITVMDTTPPVITCSADMTLEATEPSGAVATFTVTAIDLCDSLPSITVSHPSGSTFALGTTEVVCTAIDISGNTSNCTFTITVQDTTPPVVVMNGSSTMVLECSIGNYTEQGATATDLYDGIVPVVIGGDTVDTSRCGTYEVTYNATDSSGNAAEQISRTVVVADTTVPVIVCPNNITVYARLLAGIAVEYEANTVDLCDSQVDVVSSPASGSVFAPGDTTVVCTAADDSGNSSSCSFTVTVVAPVEMPMHFTPGALNPGSEGKWLKAHFVLPEGYEIGDVDVNTPAVLVPLGIESEYITVFDERGRFGESGVEIGFERGGFCDALGDFGPAEVTVSARLTSGVYFYGTDMIKVIANDFKSLSVVADYWLANGCTSPDWCGGADIDASGTVDFADFVLFDSCCVEVF